MGRAIDFSETTRAERYFHLSALLDQHLRCVCRRPESNPLEPNFLKEKVVLRPDTRLEVRHSGFHSQLCHRLSCVIPGQFTKAPPSFEMGIIFPYFMGIDA